MIAKLEVSTATCKTAVRTDSFMWLLLLCVGSFPLGPPGSISLGSDAHSSILVLRAFTQGSVCTIPSDRFVNSVIFSPVCLICCKHIFEFLSLVGKCIV